MFATLAGELLLHVLLMYCTCPSSVCPQFLGAYDSAVYGLVWSSSACIAHLQSSHQYEGICCECSTCGSGKVSMHAACSFCLCKACIFNVAIQLICSTLCVSHTQANFCVFKSTDIKVKICTVQYWPCCAVACHVLCLTAFLPNILICLYCGASGHVFVKVFHWKRYRIRLSTCYCRRGTV